VPGRRHPLPGRIEGEPEAWDWVFSDGSTSGERNPTITEDVRGDVALTVRAGDGGSDSVAQQVRFEGPDC